LESEKPMPDKHTVNLNSADWGGSLLCLLVQAMQDEISRHKWLESEKAGYDIGYPRARIDWMVRHRSKWLRSWRPTPPPC
jgi:hypothetical protein